MRKILCSIGFVVLFSCMFSSEATPQSTLEYITGIEVRELDNYTTPIPSVHVVIKRYNRCGSNACGAEGEVVLDALTTALGQAWFLDWNLADTFSGDYIPRFKKSAMF